MRRILIYGDTNLNAIDGSSVWLTSLALCLSKTNSEVYLLLKADVQDSSRLSELRVSGVNILTPFDHKSSTVDGMTVPDATHRITTLDQRYDFNIVITRGFEIAASLASEGRFRDRLWPYFTEGPAFRYRQTTDERRVLAIVGDTARRIFAQTEAARSVLEANMPTATGKTLLMTPIVPDAAFSIGSRRVLKKERNTRLNLVYAGKFARLWNTLEMPEIPKALKPHGIEARLHMIGNKFNLTDGDHEWLASMRALAARDSHEVSWYGGVSREEAFELISRADVGLSWRHQGLDTSTEISTKMIEYAALGTPPLLNRTAMHEDLLGTDYPLFIDDRNVIQPLLEISRSPSLLDEAKRRAADMAEGFSESSSVQTFEEYFKQAEGPSEISLSAHGDRPLKVLIAGHDLKFAADLLELFKQREDVELRIDKWRSLSAHDEARSREYANWADSIICEWAGPNAVFYSKHHRPGQKIFVRFHGFEIRGKWLDDLRIENICKVVFVSEFYRQKVLKATEWPRHKTTVIPNTVDQLDLQRPKIADARFHLGLVGYVPMLKRPDRAVELLQALLDQDDRYYLHIRGREPWQYKWEWNKPIQQDAYRAFYRTIAQNPRLQSHVIFEPFGPDMGNWFRKIGWILSPSTQESFHLAPVEGMMSGAVPVVWDRDGATEIFSGDFVYENTQAAAEFMLDNRSAANYGRLQERSVERALQYDKSIGHKRWVQMISQLDSPEN